MVFWRKKKNVTAQEEEIRDEQLLHPVDEPGIEPGSDVSEPQVPESSPAEPKHVDEIETVPVPAHTPVEDIKEAQDLADHTEEGGWLSRLNNGLSKSTRKITQGLGDLLTKKKLDQDMLDELEELLITADLGPKTAARIIGDFSKDRFGKDISEEEVRAALATQIADILEPVAQKLEAQKPENGPFVVLVCGVNGVGKTTTIGKFARHLVQDEKKKVFLAAGDTFRAAAVEQLEMWAKRVGASFYAKDLGDDAAAVSYEAYAQAKAENADVLLIDTAGRLHNKANLMEELKKIVRVLKKQDEAIPHATLLVLDSTTGQNAFAQLETFKEMVDINGLIVTKLDGSAKGGVLVGLADQFGVPVHAIGIGEGAEDLQPFCPREYARALMGL